MYDDWFRVDLQMVDIGFIAGKEIKRSDGLNFGNNEEWDVLQ